MTTASCTTARHFRSPDGTRARVQGAAACSPTRSLTLVTLPADNGTWGVAIVASAADKAMRAARRVGRLRPRSAQLSARRPLGRRRAAHRRRGLRQDRGPSPPVLGRRSARRHRPRRRRRRLGVHQPVTRPWRVDRSAPRRRVARRAGGGNAALPRRARRAVRDRDGGDRRAAVPRRRGRSAAIASPRSTPRSPVARTRPTTWRGSWARRCATRRRATPICCVRSSASPRSSSEVSTCSASPASPRRPLALGSPTPPPGPGREELLELLAA